MPRRRNHRRHPRLRGGYFRSLGPGLITGAADDDPSGIGTYSQVGATLRFDLVWTALVSLPLAAAVVELAARFGLVTDRGLASIVRRRYPSVVVYPVLLLVVAANTFNVGADLGSMAAALHLVAPVPLAVGVVAFAVGITVLEIRVPYERYSKLLRWLVLSLVAYFAVLLSVHVPWGEVARATFRPTWHNDRTHLAALIAIFGTTISPYLFFWQAAEEVEEHATEEMTRAELRRMRIDVVAGITAGVFVMFAILTATAVTLGKHGASIETAQEAAAALRPVAGRFASLLFTLGIVGTGLLAIPTLVGSSAYAIAETFSWDEGLSRTLRQAPGFYGVIAGGMVIGAALNFAHVNPIHALFLAALLNGLAAPPILLLMALAGRADVLGEWRSGWVSTSLVVSTAAMMTMLPAWYLVR
ncbi:MAG TPA: divalent metal cation transporter [Acidimicrobiales bacterium]|nr:divalent metal cation transporter [Acidimicrobiales bacterium]